MPSPEILDFKRLLTPVPNGAPVGADLRGEGGPNSLYYRIKDARTAARAAERQQLLGGDPDALPPDWKPILQHGVEALAEKSKDLEVAAYVIEALVRVHGFAGLRDGFHLARELVEKFWDGIYPLPDEDGLETRVAPLAGLNGADSEGTLIAPINRAPITGGQDRYGVMHYLEAKALGKIADAAVRDKKAAQGATTPDKFAKAVAGAPPSFYVNLVQDLTQCQEEFAKLGQALEQRCGPDKAPPTSNIRNALAACLDAVKDAARDKLAVAAGPAAAPAAAAGNGAAAAGGAPAGPGVAVEAVRTREDAFREILKLADFFRRTEPHAVLSYALEQIVRWGKLSLPELLGELIPEEAPRKNLFKQVGIRPEPKDKEAAKK
jgi:type VI secretion system protein ImpA